MPIHIHMGLPKTGSTTFQSALTVNRARLPQDLVVLNRMRHGPERQGLLRAHGYIRRHYKTGIDPDGLVPHLETAFGGPVSDIASEHSVLITDEGLSGPHPGQFENHTGLMPALPAALETLAVVFSGRQPVFHIVTRGTAVWMRSLYNQAVKQTGYTGSLAAFEAALPDGFDIEDHIRAVKAAHPELDIRIHRMEEHDLFPGEQILRDCGVASDTLQGFEIPARKNEGWSPAMLQAMRVINGAGIDEKSRNILRREIARRRDVFADE